MRVLNPQIGNKIKHRRKELGLTLRELAGDRVTAAQISAIENGKCNPSPRLLGYICEKLHVDLEYFTLSSEEKNRLEFEEIKVECQRLIEEEKYLEAGMEIQKTENLVTYLNEEQRGYYYFVMGFHAYKLNDFIKAFDLFVKSLTNYLKTKDNNMIADVYTKIGNCLLGMEKYDMALGYYLNSSNYIDKDIDNELVLRIYYNLAICYLHLNRINLGREYVDKCLEFMEYNDCAKKDSYLPGIDMLKGIIQMELKNNDVSIKDFEEAFEKYKRENDLVGMGKAKNNSGLCLLELGKYNEAIECFEEALYYKDNTDESNLIETYLNMVKLYKETGNTYKALEIINIAEEKMLKDDSTKGIIEVFKAKFELLYELEEYDRAEVFAFLALDAIQKNGNHKMESNLYIKLSEMYRKMGDEKSSIDYLLKANAITIDNKSLFK